MNRMTISGLALAAAIMLALPISRLLAAQGEASPKANPAPAWETSYEKALQRAQDENKRILIDFSGSDWCHWCKVMEEETLSRQAFKDYADEKLVLLFIDTPRKPQSQQLTAQSERLRRKYGVDGFPCFVVLAPDGRELDRRSGYVRGGPQNFIAFLKVTEFAVKKSEKAAE